MLVCLPSDATTAAALYTSVMPSTAKMMPLAAVANVVDSPPPMPPQPPPSWHVAPMATHKSQQILRIEIRCTCHIDLLDAQFAISHNEQTNDFFVELLSSAQHRLLSAPVLSILFRFLPSQPEHLQIFPSSYGHWRSCGSVQPLWWMQQQQQQHCPSTEMANSEEPVRLHVHVHEGHYSVELNCVEVERVEHKREFRQLPPPFDVPDSDDGMGMGWKDGNGEEQREEEEEKEDNDVGGVRRAFCVCQKSTSCIIGN